MTFGRSTRAAHLSDSGKRALGPDDRVPSSRGQQATARFARLNMSHKPRNQLPRSLGAQQLRSRRATGMTGFLIKAHRHGPHWSATHARQPCTRWAESRRSWRESAQRRQDLSSPHPALRTDPACIPVRHWCAGGRVGAEVELVKMGRLIGERIGGFC